MKITSRGCVVFERQIRYTSSLYNAQTNHTNQQNCEDRRKRKKSAFSCEKMFFWFFLFSRPNGKPTKQGVPCATRSFASSNLLTTAGGAGGACARRAPPAAVCWTQRALCPFGCATRAIVKWAPTKICSGCSSRKTDSTRVQARIPFLESTGFFCCCCCCCCCSLCFPVLERHFVHFKLGGNLPFWGLYYKSNLNSHESTILISRDYIELGSILHQSTALCAI